MENSRVIFSGSNGRAVILVPYVDCGLTLEQIIKKDVPKEALDAEIVDVSVIPTDRTFRNAWVKQKGRVGVDLEKAKIIAHDIRRRLRSEEFKPYDDVIARQIPGTSATDAEAARQLIRDKYAAIQSQIDAVTTAEELTSLTLAMQSGTLVVGVTARATTTTQKKTTTRKKRK
jgi:hypothetical protein